MSMSCHFDHLLQVSKKSLWSLILYTFFFSWFLYMYIPGAGADSPQGTSFDVNRNVLSLYPLVASIKKRSMKSNLKKKKNHDLIHVYGPGAEAEGPLGIKFWCQQKGLITLPIYCKFRRNLFEVWFYRFFFYDLIHVYSPGAGGIQPPGDKVLMSTETSCHFGLLVSNHR